MLVRFALATTLVACLSPLHAAQAQDGAANGPRFITHGQAAVEPMYRFCDPAPWIHGFRPRESPWKGQATGRPSSPRALLLQQDFLRTQGITNREAFWQRHQPTAAPEQLDPTAHLDARRVPVPADLVRATATVAGRQAEQLTSDKARPPIRQIRIAMPLAVSTKSPNTLQPDAVPATTPDDFGPLFPLPF